MNRMTTWRNANADGTEARCQHMSPDGRLAADIFETDEGITFRLDVPGVSPDDMEVKVEHRTLTVTAKPQGDGFARGALRRQFRLSDSIDSSAVDASLVHGVLTLMLPKLKTAQLRRVDIRRRE